MDTTTLESLCNFFATQPVNKAWLFGSYARGEENKDSDVDILVQFEPDAQIGLFAHTRMVMSLEQIVNRKVDLVPTGALLHFAQESVDRDKKLIYSKS